MEVTRYRWLLQGFDTCGDRGELHRFTLCTSPVQYSSYDECFEAYEYFMLNNRQRFKTLSTPAKILVQKPVTGDIKTFAQEILQLYNIEEFQNSSDEDTKTELEEDYVDGNHPVKSPTIMWDLYRVACCGKAGHYAPYTRSPMLFETLQGCMCDFARYFLHHVNSDTTDWCLLVHAKK